MAIDTEAKRGSALNFGRPWAPVILPAPDGSVDDGDQLHFLGLYSGIALEEPVDEEPEPEPEPIVTKLQVLQLAALDLGLRPPTDSNAPGNITSILNARYDTARREFISEHSWIGCTSFFKGNLLVTPPAFNWANQFSTPPDMVRLVKVNGVRVDAGTDKFTVAPDTTTGAKVVMTDADEVNIEYVRDIIDVSAFEPKQLTAFAHFLSWQVARSFGKDQRAIDSLEKQFDSSMADARAIDSQQRSAPRITESAIMRARRAVTIVDPRTGF